MTVLLQLLSPMILSDALAGGSSGWVSFLLGGSAFLSGWWCMHHLDELSSVLYNQVTLIVENFP